MKQKFEIEIECKWKIGDTVSCGSGSRIGKIVDIGNYQGDPSYQIHYYEVGVTHQHGPSLGNGISWFPVERMNGIWEASEPPKGGGPLVVSPSELTERWKFNVWLLYGEYGLSKREVADVLFYDHDIKQITSHVAITRRKDEYLLVWWNRELPSDTEITALMKHQTKWEKQEDK